MSEFSGSKPKKLIKRHNFSNPTLLSRHIGLLFNPELSLVSNEKQIAKQLNQQKNQIQAKKHSRQKSQITFDFDSLNMAQNEFEKRKKSLDLRLDRQNPAGNFQKIVESKLNSPGYQATVLSCSSPFSRFNYLHSQSIKAKQNHGFNIISGQELINY